ncbi:MAG: bifunctional 4-hydroxy-2-oxoglutarate aldolase/2-dehydro-3-deoxy-phosphogluconate aldolase [Thermostichales cyanobacterium SZTDM-1c_bins_54]
MTWLEALRQAQILAVIRSRDPEMAWQQGEALIQAGYVCLEVTATTPDYEQVIRQLRHKYPGIWVGCGTVTTPERAAAAIQGGSQFLVSPIFTPQVLHLGHMAGIPVVTGGLTPSEIWQGWVAGAAAVKVFPIASVGGASYLRHLQGPFPGIPLIASGGISLGTVQEYLQAGAVAVAVGTGLLKPA